MTCVGYLHVSAVRAKCYIETSVGYWYNLSGKPMGSVRRWTELYSFGVTNTCPDAGIHHDQDIDSVKRKKKGRLHCCWQICRHTPVAFHPNMFQRRRSPKKNSESLGRCRRIFIPDQSQATKEPGLSTSSVHMTRSIQVSKSTQNINPQIIQDISRWDQSFPGSVLIAKRAVRPFPCSSQVP